MQCREWQASTAASSTMSTDVAPRQPLIQLACGIATELVFEQACVTGGTREQCAQVRKGAGRGLHTKYGWSATDAARPPSSVLDRREKGLHACKCKFAFHAARSMTDGQDPHACIRCMRGNVRAKFPPIQAWCTAQLPEIQK